jgi:metal-responsive CopG/Arc/MetJ family transcriptional regulator
MKGRLTLTLPKEVVRYIKDVAKAKGITASQVVEDLFLDFIAEDERMSDLKNNLKKVS